MEPNEIVQAINTVCDWVAAHQQQDTGEILLDGEDRTEATVVVYALRKWRDRFIAIYLPEWSDSDAADIAAERRALRAGDESPPSAEDLRYDAAERRFWQHEGWE